MSTHMMGFGGKQLHDAFGAKIITGPSIVFP